jgi:hypothetical protein
MYFCIMDSATSIFVAYNGFFGDIQLTLPGNLPGNRWYLVADTGGAMEAKDNVASPPRQLDAPSYKTTGRSVAIFRGAALNE